MKKKWTKKRKIVRTFLIIIGAAIVSLAAIIFFRKRAMQWNPLLVSCETGVYYTEEDGNPVPHYDTNYREYMIDLGTQFFEAGCLQFRFTAEEEHSVLFADADGKIIRIEKLGAGVHKLETEQEEQYIFIPLRNEEEAQMGLGAEKIRGDENSVASESRFNGKSFSVLGDSVSMYPFSIAAHKSISPYETFAVSDMWWYRLAEKLGMDICRINAYGGSGVTDQTFTSNTPELAASMGRGRDLGLGGQKPDVIIVWIGGNDIYSDVPHVDIAAAYRKMMDDIQKAYPKAELYLCTYYSCSEKYQADEQWLNEEIRTVAAEYGADVIELENCGISWEHSEEYLLDGMHPNQKGFRLLAAWMAEEMLN